MTRCLVWNILEKEKIQAICYFTESHMERLDGEAPVRAGTSLTYGCFLSCRELFSGHSNAGLITIFDVMKGEKR